MKRERTPCPARRPGGGAGRAGSAFGILFFISGAAALGYQVAWAKAFAAGIGHEFPAVLAVVTAFMAGMALGAAAFERLPAHLKNDARSYGWLEWMIGAWGMVSAMTIPVVNRTILRLLGPDPAPAFHWFIVFIVVLGALLPATAAMGATLAPMERFLSMRLGKSTTALVYAANTAGAVAGALGVAFWLMHSIGVRDSIRALAVANFACGGAALWAMRTGPPAGREKTGSWGRRKFDRLLAARLLLTGLLGLGFETVIIRALSQVLANTVYTFAVVLAVYLCGNALGAAAQQRVQRKHHFSTAWLFALLAFTSFTSGLLLRETPRLYETARAQFGDSIYAAAFSEAFTAALVFLPPSIFMGATFSALAESSLAFRPNLCWSLSLNLLGGALGPLLFGLCLLPLAGLKASVASISILYLLLAAKPKWFVALPLFLLAAPLLTGLPGLLEHEGQKILSFKNGVMASVAVLEEANGQRVLKVNNHFQMGGTGARLAEERHADIPLLLHPHPHRALFIGLGTGITFATAANYPDLTADGVELLPEVAEAMRWFQADPHTLDNPNLRLHVADGRRFLQTTTNRYDVIVGDLFHPAQDGAAFLYTEEHFAAVRARLNPDGLFCQWLPVYQLDLRALAILMKTFQRVFPNAQLWLLRLNIDTPVIGLIGWKSPPALTEDCVETKWRSAPALHEHLRQTGLADSLRLFGSFIGPVDSSALIQTAPLNTDDKPEIMFEAPKLILRHQDDVSARLLALVKDFESPDLPLVKPSAAFEKRFTAYTRARDLYLQGLADEQHGHPIQAVASYIETARISPDFTSGYAQALAIATSLISREPDAAKRILRDLADAQPNRPIARELLDRLEKRE